MKAMINRSNYETFFVDYFDGKLDKAQAEELHAFLKNNPDLKEEFDLFGSITTEPDLTVNFPGKDRLKRNTTTVFNYKTRLIAYVENDLDAEQMKEVEGFLASNPSVNAEFELLKRARLTPEMEIVYDKKKELKKGGKVISFASFIRPLSAAAAVIILFLIANYFLNKKEDVQPVITEQTPVQNNNHPKNDSLPANSNSSVEKKNNVIIKQQNIKITPPSLNNKPAPLALTPKNNRHQGEIQQQVTPAPNENIEFAKKNDSNPSIISPEKSIISPDSSNVAQNNELQNNSLPAINNKINKSDIFDETDLKEFSENASRKGKPGTPSNKLLNIAGSELKDIAKSANIEMGKETNADGQSTTYALAIGKSFSISHITGK